MIVLRQGTSMNIAVEVDGVSPYTFSLVKREDLTEKSFEMASVEVLRDPIFNFQVVTDPNQENIPLGLVYLTAGQYDYIISGNGGVLNATGVLRVDVFDRDLPTEYNVDETFKVYGQE